MTVAPVVLSWNRREDTLTCLRSLARSDYAALRVIVVDNGSVDGTVDAVRLEFPEVELIELPANAGYTGGMNAGLRRVLDLGEDYALVLNNDVELAPDAIGALVDTAQRSADVAALSPVINFADRRDLVWYAGSTFDPGRGYNGRLVGYEEPGEAHDSVVRDTDVACGAAMLVPRTVLERLGLFDEPLFAYGEDAEWSLRATKAGYRLLVVGASRAWHRVSASSGGEGSPAALYYSTRNLLAVCERHAPLGHIGTWRRRIVLLGAHLAHALRTRQRRAAVRATLNGWRDFRRGRFGPRAA